MDKFLRLFCLIILSFAISSTASADYSLLEDQRFQNQDKSFLVAQWEGDDSYDPFADYSEFDETEEEEADINFFLNGRLFTIAFAANYRSFTNSLGNIYKSSTGFGLFLTYFFDLRFAVQIGFTSGDHALDIQGPSATSTAQGNVSLTGTSFDVKYFLNTQNVTRGLANLNPYILVGLTQFHRTVSLTDQVAFAKDSAVGLNLGAGLEVPLMRGKMYLGAQGAYHMVKFADENQEIVLNGDTSTGSTGIIPSGDIFTIQATLGINF